MRLSSLKSSQRKSIDSLNFLNHNQMIITLLLQHLTLRNLIINAQLKSIYFDSALKIYRTFDLILKLHFQKSFELNLKTRCEK